MTRITRVRVHLSDRLRGRVDPGLLDHLARRIRRAARRMGVGDEALAQLGVRVVDDEEMAALHQAFLAEARPTDVLSFNAAELPGEDSRGRGSLGDIVIDWQAVERQALGSTPAALLDEATVLAIHGLAHLLGHDHRNRHEGRRMHRLERRVLRGLRVADRARPYAPRLYRPTRERK